VTLRNEDVGRGETKPFPVVGVGSSAGGLEAVQNLFRALPSDTGMAFVVVPHLEPSRESSFPDILAKVTLMPVTEVKDGMRVEAGHVYTIPGNGNLTLSQGCLRLTPRSDILPHSLAIDPFLLSLAKDQKNLAIGVILSGSGSDGAHGITAIKAEGGITFAQDKSAEFDSMPEAAVGTGCIDFVLPTDEIARELYRIGQHPMMASAELERENDIRTSVGDDKKPKDVLLEILNLVRKSAKIDFTSYKSNTIRRRISRRMLVCRIDKLEDYYTFLENHPSEVVALHKDLLINVTSFFRDPEAFKALEKEILPRVMKNRPLNSPIRIWVAGCSTGEEVYSIAMCLLEFLGDTRQNCTIQIFGTDVSDQAIAMARSGIYPESVMADISEDRRRRFFTPVGRGSQISKTVRELCVFAKHNVAEDPPFSNMDLVSCRNLFIYLLPILQKRVLSLFHYALTPRGFLVLGSSESIGPAEALFSPVDTKHKIFAKKLATGQPRFHFSTGTSTKADNGNNQLTAKQSESLAEFNLTLAIDRALVSRFPDGVVINEDMDILQVRGHTGTYLEASPGNMSNNVLKMARPALVSGLRSAIHRARQENCLIRKQGVPLATDGDPLMVSIEVTPIQESETNGRYFFVSFSKSFARAAPIFKRKTHSKGSDTSLQIVELEKELASTHEYLQSLIEKAQTDNEELRAANEEITSSNEELRSTNEEMQTSKEELNSVNEELSTVNDELQNRNVQLNQLNGDINNLIESVAIPVVIVGRDLCIRRFTPAATKVMKLVPTDVGRPIADIKTNIDIPDLIPLLTRAFKNDPVEEREVRDSKGCWYSVAISPYWTVETYIDGAVITLFDIDAMRRALDNLAKVNVELEQFAYVASHDLQEPLRLASTYLELLLRRHSDKLDEEAREYIEVAMKSAKRMKNLIEDLLVFSRTGKEHLKYEPIDCSVLVDKTIASLSPRLKEAHAEVTHSELPTINSSEVLIGLVFQNLISNAVKFRGHKSPRVQISAQENKLEWQFSVRDNGIGIEAEYGERIFLIFQRLHGPDKYSGTGIGLAICKRIVERYEGRIWVESKPGEGSTFFFTIPKKAT
jgi:two-component system CheB/CheR fusion protein